MKRFVVMAALVLAVIGTVGVYGEAPLFHRYDGSDYTWIDMGRIYGTTANVYDGKNGSSLPRTPPYYLLIGFEGDIRKGELWDVLTHVEAIKSAVDIYFSEVFDMSFLTLPDKEVSFTGKAGTYGGFLLKSRGIHVERQIGELIESILDRPRNKISVQILPGQIRYDVEPVEPIVHKSQYPTDFVQHYVEWYNEAWPGDWKGRAEDPYYGAV